MGVFISFELETASTKEIDALCVLLHKFYPEQYQSPLAWVMGGVPTFQGARPHEFGQLDELKVGGTDSDDYAGEEALVPVAPVAKKRGRPAKVDIVTPVEALETTANLSPDLSEQAVVFEQALAEYQDALIKGGVAGDKVGESMLVWKQKGPIALEELRYAIKVSRPPTIDELRDAVNVLQEREGFDAVMEVLQGAKATRVADVGRLPINAQHAFVKRCINGAPSV